MATAQLTLSGLGFQYLWPEALAWQAMSPNIGFAATGLFGATFTRIFLNTARHHPLLDQVIVVIAAAFAVTALAPLLLPYRLVAVTTSLTGVAFATVAVAAGVVCLRRGDQAARFFLLAWALLLVGVAAMGLRKLALLPTNLFTANAIQIGSALELLLLFFALAVRIQLLRRDKDWAQAGEMADVHRVAAKVAGRLCGSIEFAGQTTAIGASVGVAVWPVDGCAPLALLHAADQAMYARKREHHEAVGIDAKP